MSIEEGVLAKVISQFFADLGIPLRNIRWSWCARNEKIVLLRTWQDEYAGNERKVTVSREPAAHQETDSFGPDERIVQLESHSRASGKARSLDTRGSPK